jgi:hypothetical protein
MPSLDNQVFLMRSVFVSANRQLLPPAFTVTVPGYRVDSLDLKWAGAKVGELQFSWQLLTGCSSLLCRPTGALNSVASQTR